MTTLMALPTPAENMDAHTHQGVLVEHATTGAIDATPPDTTNRSLTVIEAETIRYHLTNARSQNTRLAYERQWNLFTRWCEREGFSPFPAQVSTVILYLTYLGDENFKLSKIQQALSAIKALHSDNIDRLHSMGVAPDLSFKHPHIASTMQSVRRNMVTKGLTSVKKPRHFSQNEVLAMVKACPDTPAGIQDKAILLLGVNLGLRSSEFASLTVENLVFDSRGVDIHLATSKTDQLGEGVDLFVARLSPSMWDFDAVKALEEWMSVRETLNLPLRSLFVAFRRGGNSLHMASGAPHALTRDAIGACVQRCATRAGLAEATQSISSHSLRHTFITTGFGRQIDAATIAKSSRHKTMSVLMGYDQTSRRDAAVSVKLWA